MPNPLISDEIISTLQSHLQGKSDLLVAFSGGVDSTVLLHALNTLKQQSLPNLNLSAIYIHHGISQNADDWAHHCETICRSWGIEIAVKKVILDLTAGNIEQQARDARYQAFSRHLNRSTNKKTLCIAQHLDDQAETFLLALKRGSGPTGLSSMKIHNQFGEFPLIRPLLTISREKIEQYAKENQLIWIEDESNQDDKYDRNFLRLRILPKLNQRWPHFNEMVARSAELCREQQELLDELLLNSFNELLTPSGSLNIEPLLTESTLKRNALLRMWFKYHQVSMPSRMQLELIWKDIAQSKLDANPQFKLNNHQIRRYQNQLYLLPLFQDLKHTIIHWNLDHAIKLPDNIGTLNCSKSSGNCRLPNSDEIVTVRFMAQGEFLIDKRTHRRSIKKIWQELNIPPWLRTRIPLIFYNDQLITAVNVFITEEGKGTDIQFNLCK